MKSIKIDGVKYNLPETWLDVTFEQYIKIQEVDEKTKLKKSIAILSILSGIEIEILNDLPLDMLNKFVGFLDFVSQEIPTEKKKCLIINDIEHEYLGSLEKISIGQYADIDFEINQERTPLRTLSYILPILYLPKGKEYNSAYSESVVNDFLNLPVTDVFGVIGFFLSNYKSSKKNTITYSIIQQLVVKVLQK